MSPSFARRLLDEMRESDNPEEQAAFWDSEFRAGLARVLREAREDAELTQADVADLMGTSQPHVSDIEGLAVDPRLSTLQRYARAVGGEICLLALRLADGQLARVNPRGTHRAETSGTSAVDAPVLFAVYSGGEQQSEAPSATSAGTAPSAMVAHG